MLYKKNEKVKQKENLPEEVSVMFEKPGKLKAVARQDSKSRNEQDSKRRNPNVRFRFCGGKTICRRKTPAKIQ